MVGCFWTWQEGVFCLFFSGFDVIVVCFCVSGSKVAKVLKMLVCFPVLGLFVGRLILVYLGLEGLGVFVFLVFVFLWFRYFSLFFFVFVLLFDCCWCCSCFIFSFFCLCVCVFFLCFLCFLCFFCFYVFVCFVFVFVWRGFQGQVTKPSLFFVFFLCFPFFAFDRKNPVFPLKKGILVYFSVSPFVSL